MRYMSIRYTRLGSILMCTLINLSVTLSKDALLEFCFQIFVYGSHDQIGLSICPCPDVICKCEDDTPYITHTENIQHRNRGFLQVF